MQHRVRLMGREQSCTLLAWAAVFLGALMAEWQYSVPLPGGCWHGETGLAAFRRAAALGYSGRGCSGPKPARGGQARPFAQADDRWLPFMQPGSGVWHLEQCGGTKQ